MGLKLPLSDEDRAFLLQMRAIQVSDHGGELFVGLGQAESDEYLRLLTTEDQSDAERQREQELFEKHEPHRLEIVAAEAEAERVRCKH